MQFEALPGTARVATPNGGGQGGVLVSCRRWDSVGITEKIRLGMYNYAVVRGREPHCPASCEAPRSKDFVEESSPAKAVRHSRDQSPLDAADTWK